MKVALVMPMATGSAIANVTLQAVPYLTKVWDLEIWCPREESLLPSPVPLQVFDAADEATRTALLDYDLVIHVLGNSGWHAEILPLCREVPGLVVLHDYALTDLFRVAALRHDELEDVALHVEETFGPDDAELFVAAGGLLDAEGWLRFSSRVTFSDLALADSLGAVVHSRWHAASVDGFTLGDVTVAPLPIPVALDGNDPIGSQEGDLATEHLLSMLPDDAVLLVTIGAVNANRRVDMLLEALAAAKSPSLHLWAVGPCAPDTRQRLRAHAAELGVEARFAAPGPVSDAVLDDVLARADIAAALRDPVLEGQSASVLTQMLAGVPVVVLDHAHYCDLPDDAVVKVPVRDGLSTLVDALATLTADPARRADMGARGKAWASTSRRPSDYAAAIVEAAEAALATHPVRELAGDLASRLRGRDLDEHDVVVSRVADVAFDLFAATEAGGRLSSPSAG
jgi:glycosyltransferase involved in cell wall biosynthesis